MCNFCVIVLAMTKQLQRFMCLHAESACPNHEEVLTKFVQKYSLETHFRFPIIFFYCLQNSIACLSCLDIRHDTCMVHIISISS